MPLPMPSRHLWAEDHVSADGRLESAHRAAHGMIRTALIRQPAWTLLLGPEILIEMGPGDVVADRFEIQRFAGAGGMGTVYRAEDRLRGEAVALKILRGGGAAEELR